ncbi:MAG: cyanase [Nitrospira sp. SB0677_bin_15]|nr:cyanase [Nitrospira sp. SB0667_bin_9]MYD30252.1 cyanase [Nitrospira sp. SB0661_bin_20]MYG39654.1 cyanase [Nitrospira sp. SB0677_bin_15]MYH02085.1 cyanase [Nitrospira sp. SB0675_bin_23]MYJ23643.1 cyanase [Nitrospira sp. SB0673_bin_12]
MNDAKAVIKAKRLEKNIALVDVAAAVGKSPTFVAAALTGNHRLTPEQAATVGKLLDLDQESTASLSRFPVRADFPNMSDPFKYRLLEVIGVYGDALREMANETFGDGIMSAIDFSIDMEKVKGSQGEDRCKITLNGKWLEYKTF